MWWRLVAGFAGSTEAAASWQPPLILVAAHCCLNAVLVDDPMSWATGTTVRLTNAGRK
jgi:hypothetical protein